MLPVVEFWKQWEGRSVDTVFPLERFLGEGNRGAVFETRFQGQPAAIKLIPGTPEAIGKLGKCWENAAAQLSHPALVRIFAHGETELGDRRCAYVVMERGDENLADVLTERSLSAAETREMLGPLLGALGYLHAQGFAHGGLKPSNILANGEQLKISSDGLIPGGDPAVDCGAVGTLLEAVLGADRNQPLPAPFAEIAGRCLMPNPPERWSVAQIEACLRGEAAAPAKRSRAIWWGLAAAVAATLSLISFWPSPEPGNPKPNAAASPPKPPPVESVAVNSPAVTDRQPPQKVTPPVPPPKKPKQQHATAVERTPAPAPAATTVEGVTRVLPEIPRAALSTIVGRVRINVRVRVDSAGNVSEARLEPPPASKYFTSRVLTAAQAWKFPPGAGSQDWALQFELTREQVRASLAKIGN